MSKESDYRVLVTRSSEDSFEWSDELDKLGIGSTIFPCIYLESIENSLLDSSYNINKKEWIIFTSKNGVESFNKIKNCEIDSYTKIAAIGKSTAERCRNYFNRVDYIGKKSDSRSFSEELLSIIKRGSSVLLVVAENASDVIEFRLNSAEIFCERVNTYRTIPFEKLENKKLLSSFNINTIFFASPSSIIGFINQVEVDVKKDIYTIGPTTNETAKSLGIEVTGMSREPSLAGLIKVMK